MSEMTAVVDQIKEIGTHLTEFRTRLEDAPNRADLKESEARIVDDMVKRFIDKQALEAVLQKVDEVETRLARIGEDTGRETKDMEERAAMRSFLQHGREGNEVVGAYISALTEKRALAQVDATAGGFLIPEIVEAGIDKDVVNMSPVRTVARVTQTTGPSIKVNRRTGTPTGGWVGEKETQSESSATYGQIEVVARKISVRTDVTQDMIDDVPGIEAEVAFDAAEEIARIEGLGFISGSGNDQPEGIVTNSDVSTVTGADAANDLVAADDFYTLLTTLKEPYRKNGRFLLNSTVLGKVLKLKDSNNNYLWNFAAGFSAGIPELLAGRPFTICEDIADDGTDGNKPLYFGDWQKGYRIVDRIGIVLTRDPYSDAGNDNLRLYWKKRVGGRVIRDEAIKILVV